jgi:lysophospholipase L1-like esterase
MTRPPAAPLRYGIGLLLGAQLLLLGCGSGGGTTSSSADPPMRTPATFDFGPNDPLRVTAFGDSITLGVLGDRANGALVTTGNNYPNNLQLALRGLDPGWRVVNRGASGERTVEGRNRLPGVLTRDRPGFVLIMEGTNDAAEGDAPTAIVANLETMVDRVKANRSIPVLGTIPPNFRNAPAAQEIIRVANGLIRSSARARGVGLAEIFDGMNDPRFFGSPERGIRDPLHPNEEGYVRMAGIWFMAMQQAIPATSTATLHPPGPPSPPPGGRGGPLPATATLHPPGPPVPAGGPIETGQRARAR